MRDATAGDPITGVKWSHKALRKVSRVLRQRRCRASAPTISRLLEQQGFALHVNAKRLAGRRADGRGRQFAYLVRRRRLSLSRGWPVVSVDSKKRELVGSFKNRGRAWRQGARDVNMYDFLSDALGIAVLYGVYDVGRNQGYVAVRSGWCGARHARVRSRHDPRLVAQGRTASLSGSATPAD